MKYLLTLAVAMLTGCATDYSLDARPGEIDANKPAQAHTYLSEHETWDGVVAPHGVYSDTEGLFTTIGGEPVTFVRFQDFLAISPKEYQGRGVTITLPNGLSITADEFGVSQDDAINATVQAWADATETHHQFNAAMHARTLEAIENLTPGLVEAIMAAVNPVSGVGAAVPVLLGEDE